MLIHRSLWGHVVFRNFTEAAAFAWMISQAAWTPTRVRYKGLNLSLERGQLAVSGRDLAVKFGWSEARCRRFLSRLETDAMIDAASDAGVNVVTIKNYDRYQAVTSAEVLPIGKSDAPPDAPGDAAATQQRRTEQRTKQKNSYTGDFEAFWTAFPSRGKHANPKWPAFLSFQAAITRGIPAETIIKAAALYARYIAAEGKSGTDKVAQAKTWLSERRWDDAIETATVPDRSGSRLRVAI